MSQIIVAYWSGTGNTEIMAQAIGKGIAEGGGEVRVVSMEEIQPRELKKCDAFALGCPAMGAEELEDTIVEPFVSEVETFAAGKRIALFGSYDWGGWRMDADLDGPHEGVRSLHCRRRRPYLQ